MDYILFATDVVNTSVDSQNGILSNLRQYFILAEDFQKRFEQISKMVNEESGKLIGFTSAMCCDARCITVWDELDVWKPCISDCLEQFDPQNKFASKISNIEKLEKRLSTINKIDRIEVSIDYPVSINCGKTGKEEVSIHLWKETPVMKEANEQQVKIFLNKYDDKLSKNFLNRLMKNFKNTNICEYGDIFDSFTREGPIDFEEKEICIELMLHGILSCKKTIWKIML